MEEVFLLSLEFSQLCLHVRKGRSLRDAQEACASVWQQAGKSQKLPRSRTCQQPPPGTPCCVTGD